MTIPAAAAAEPTGVAADCAVCHDTLVPAFQQTPHALARKDAPDCTTCHGDGTKHMDAGGDTSLISLPAGPAGEQLCLRCHDALHGAFNGGEVHSRSAVACFDCHTIHPPKPGPAHLLRQEPNTLCATCHPGQERAFSRPFGHRIGRAGLECVSCHDPHGGSGQQSLKVDDSGDPVCVSCHADKRGPFTFPHVVNVTDGCLSCHEPHGSSNPHALIRSRVDQLCLECHSPIGGNTLGSQPPAFHNLYDPRYRECTVCHVAVHGSNTSPTLTR
jgi:DmsE family decaheme c-type cytochrome